LRIPQRVEIVKEAQILRKNNHPWLRNNFIGAHDVPSGALSLRPAPVLTSGSEQGFVCCKF
jgi:hypothetical protein